MERGQMKKSLLLVKEENENEESGAGSSSPTPVLILSTLVTAAGTFAYGCAAGYSSPVESAIRHDVGLSTAEYSVFGSIMTIGGMIGAIISGNLADLIGRRWTMWVLEIFCMMGWISIAFAQSAWWLDMGRLLLGIGVALHLYVSNVYLAEITPSNIRGGCLATNQLLGCSGISLMYFIGNLVSWRTLALIGVIPCLVHTIGLFFMPESPRWLAKIGKDKEMEESLQRLRGKCVDISEETTEIKDSIKALQLLPDHRFVDLFKQAHIHSLIVGVGLMLLVQFGGTSGFSFYASSIFERAGWPVGFGTFGLAIIQIPFSGLSIVLMDRFGRRQIMMATTAGVCLGCILIGLGFLLQATAPLVNLHDIHQQQVVTAALVMTGMLMYSAFFSMGMGNIPWIIMSEIFAINVKGTAGSLVTLVNWIGSWIISYAFNFLFEWSSSGVFFIFASICCVLVIFVAKLVPETKGKTLEEIQESMSTFLH